MILHTFLAKLQQKLSVKCRLVRNFDSSVYCVLFSFQEKQNKSFRETSGLLQEVARSCRKCCGPPHSVWILVFIFMAQTTLPFLKPHFQSCHDKKEFSVARNHNALGAQQDTTLPPMRVSYSGGSVQPESEF